MTIEKIDAENKAAIFQALVDKVDQSISVLTEIENLKAQLKDVSKQNDVPEAMTKEELVELENALLDVVSIIYSENPVRTIQVVAVTLAAMVHKVSKDQNFDPTEPVEIPVGGGCVVEVWGAMTMGT